MIDTIVLMLEQADFEIVEHDRFTPSTEHLYKPPYFKGSCVQNPTKSDHAEGNYKPRLTVITRKYTHGFGIVMYIEFSATKLLYGNNFEEVSDGEFLPLLEKLQQKLLSMGVKASSLALTNAKLSTIHFSKNILLLDHTRCSMVLAELVKLNLWSRLDVNMRDYRNGGQVLKWHANSYEITLYDKMKDLRKARISKKRAFETDPLWQTDLFKRHDFPKQMEVLRMEIRLNKRRVIKDMLKRLDVDASLTFSGLFKVNIAQAVILHHWNFIKAEVNMASLLAIDARDPAKLAESIIHMKPRIKPSKVTQAIGTLLLFQQVGAPGIKAIFANSPKRVVQGLMTQCRNHTPKSHARWMAINEVSRQLQDFSPINLQKYSKVRNHD